MIGLSLEEFLCHLESALRQRYGRDITKFCSACGEQESVVQRVREGKDTPTRAMLDCLGYVRTPHSYMGWALLTEERYIKKRSAIDESKRKELEDDIEAHLGPTPPEVG